MPHAFRRLSSARVRICAVALLGLAGCLTQQPRLQSDDDAEREKDREVRTIGDVTTIANANPIPVSGIGLVVGLEGTGGRAAVNGYRTEMEGYLHKNRVEHVKEILDSPNTSIVLVAGIVPAGARKGDAIDLEVMLPPQSKTTSLRSGYLKYCLLYNYDSKKHVDPNFKGPDGPLKGHAVAEAEGPVLVDAGSGSDGERLKTGRIWGGGHVRAARSFFILLNEEYKRAAVAQTVADRVNETLTGQYHGTTMELASAKNNQVIVLSVPEQYRLNMPRYLRVVRLVPMRDTGVHSPYRQQMERDLLDPKRTVTAALRLEALGSGSIESLKRGLTSDHALVRFCAAEALAYLGDPACGEVLAKTVEGQPMLRAFALTAMASLDENVCRVRLADLLASPAPEVRYGAFRALRALDDRDTAVAGEFLNESFWLHRVAPQSAPLVHLAHSRRAEVVLFGEDATLTPPFSFLSGEFTVTAGRDDNKCTITRLSLYRGTGRKQVSFKVEEILRTLADMGASYPNVDELLTQADRCVHAGGARCLSAPLAIDALPQETSVFELAKSGANNVDFTKDDDAEISNAKMDIGATPSLFEKSNVHRTAPMSAPASDLDDLEEHPPLDPRRSAQRR
jgi:hypothetical protein